MNDMKYRFVEDTLIYLLPRPRKVQSSETMQGFQPPTESQASTIMNMRKSISSLVIKLGVWREERWNSSISPPPLRER